MNILPEAISQLAITACAEVQGTANACTEPCDECWQEAERILVMCWSDDTAPTVRRG